MSKQTHPAYRGPWATIRKQILTRDNHTCQIKSKRCTGTATHVDHIIPVTQGGAWWDPDNLRAACSTCNYGRIDRSKQETWRTANTHITLIIGPPGINKQQAFTAQPSDLIIDYDEIAAAIGISNHPDLHGPALAARGAILREVKAGRVKSKRCFIISSNPKAESLFPYHSLKVVDPGREATLKEVGFIKGGGTGGGRLIQLVEEWYRVREGGTRHGHTNSKQW